MGQFWRTKSFRTLSKNWNKKLYQSGFIDSEIESSQERELKQKATNSYRNPSQLERELKLEYYSCLGHLANNTIFKNPLEQLIMIRHSEGFTIKEIFDEIKLNGISRDRKTIRYIIRRWQTIWGVRTWSLKQMNLKR